MFLIPTYQTQNWIDSYKEQELRDFLQLQCASKGHTPFLSPTSCYLLDSICAKQLCGDDPRFSYDFLYVKPEDRAFFKNRAIGRKMTVRGTRCIVDTDEGLRKMYGVSG